MSKLITTFWVNGIYLFCLLPRYPMTRSQNNVFLRTGTRGSSSRRDQTAVLENQSQTKTNKNAHRAQPIKNVTNFTTLKNKQYLINRPNRSRNSNLTLDHCSSDTDSHTFSPRSSCLSRVVIRNLHFSSLSSDIYDALPEFSHSVRHVENIKKCICLCRYFL